MSIETPITTGADFIAVVRRQHNHPRNCPACGQSIATTALTKCAYTFEPCSCGKPSYTHLIETVWHRICLLGTPE